jgi:hypothetical protein
MGQAFPIFIIFQPDCTAISRINKCLMDGNPMPRPILIALLAVPALSACMEGGPVFGPPAGASAVNSATPELGNTLPQSGQGNSGGVLALNGQPPIAGVEATMAYNAGGRGAGARVDFHNGPMVGVGIRCARAGGGATVPECTTVNATNAYLVNELSGSHAYAGAFAVNGYGAAKNQNGFVAIHSGPAGGNVQMPGASTAYRGQFQAGGNVTSGGQVFSGRVTGSMDMTANFASGTMNGTFSGQVLDDRTKLSAPLDAGFTAASIDPNARFFNTSNTTFSYNGQQAWGELDGAFYGPNAEEAAGAFGFGNSTGGMTGIMIGCSEYNPANCIAPTPRF